MAIQPSTEFTEDVNNVYIFQFKTVFPNFDLLESTLQAVQEMNHTVYYNILPRAKALNESFQEKKDDIVFLSDNITLTGKIILDFQVTLRKEILAVRKFCGFGKNPLN